MEMLKRVTDLPAQTVKKWSQIKDQATELTAFLDAKNGNFNGNWKGAYALHACQIGDSYLQRIDDPFNYFVVADNVVPPNLKEKIMLWLGRKSVAFYFRSRVIINPEILETPTHFEKILPKQDFTKNADKTINIQYQKVKQKLANEMDLKEACMTFPDRTQKYVRRYFRIKVRYQIPILGFLYTKTEWIEGLQAHIFQHEFDHGQGDTIYYKDKKSK